MVFPGHFSTGCSRCRQRKVKCDERKPSCRRCYIYGEPCPGYSDQFQFRYRKNGKQKANPKPEKSGPSNSSVDSQVPPSAQCTKFIIDQSTWQSRRHTNTNNASRLSVPAALPVSLEHMSLCYFVRRFVSPGCSDSYPGHLTFLPDILDTDNHGLLELATLSVAQIAAFNQYGGDQLLRNAHKNHGRAIRQLRDAINANTLYPDDKSTTAVLMLSAFIDVSGENSGDPKSHASGLYYLLERRGPEQLSTRVGFELYVLALIRLQVYCFIYNDISYIDPCGISEVLGFLNPIMQAFYMVSRTLKLRHSLLFADRTAYNSPHNVDGSEFDGAESIKTDEAAILQECFDALEKFHRWDSEAGDYWKSTFGDRTEPSTLNDPAAATRHFDLETACTMILVRSGKLMLLDSLLHYHQNKQQLDPHADTTPLFGENMLSLIEQGVWNTIDDMLSCVPYALGDLDPNGRRRVLDHDGAGALVIFQPLRLITFCLYSKPEQVAACEEVLKRLNTSMGLRSAISWTNDPLNDGQLMRPNSSLGDGPFNIVNSENQKMQDLERDMFDVSLK